MHKLVAVLLAASAVVTVAAHAATPSAGALIKGSLTAVYYYAHDGKRYVFPTEKTYRSWYQDFSSVDTLTDADLAAIPIGGNVTYRPGVRLVKIQTDPKTYAVDANGTLRWITTEAIAAALYGADWATKVDDLPDPFFVNYRTGASLSSAADFSPSGATALAGSIAVDRGIVDQELAAPPPDAATSTPPMASSSTPFSLITLAPDSPGGDASPSGEQVVARFLLTGDGAVLTLMNVDIGGTVSNASPRAVKFYKDAVGSGNLLATSMSCVPPAASCDFGRTTLADGDFLDLGLGATARAILVTADTQEALSGKTLTVTIPSAGIHWSDGDTADLTLIDGLPLVGKTFRY